MESMEGIVKIVEQLQIAMDIIDGYNADVGGQCDRLIKRVECIRLKIDKANKMLEESAFELEKSKKLDKQFDVLKAKLLYIQQHFPRGIIKISNEGEEEEEEENQEEEVKIVEKEIKLSTPMNPRKVGTSNMTNGLVLNSIHHPPLLHVPSINFPSSGSSVSSSTGRISPNTDQEISVSHVTDEEFNQVSSYMKGRLTVANLNEFVDSFNSTLNKKYKVLNKSKKLKTKQELDQCLVWKEQETGDLKGAYFCTAEDFAKLSGIKIGNKKYLSIITVLRHLKRIKEVRTLKIIHYVACF